MTEWRHSKFRAWWEGDSSVPTWLSVVTTIGLLVLLYFALRGFLWLIWPMACGIDGGRC